MTRNFIKGESIRKSLLDEFSSGHPSLSICAQTNLFFDDNAASFRLLKECTDG